MGSKEDGYCRIESFWCQRYGGQLMTSNDLKTTRKDLGLTQEQAGKAIGMKRQAYNLIENHRSPTKIHEAGIKMLVFIKKHGLLKKFILEG
jgi:hypothetical protein